MSSRARAVFPGDCTKGMGFASCIITGKLLREGSDSVGAEPVKRQDSYLKEILRGMVFLRLINAYLNFL